MNAAGTQMKIEDEQMAMATDEFFARINRGRQFGQITLQGETILLHLHDPDPLDIGRAGDLFDQLKAGVDRIYVRDTLIRLVCLACIDGVNDRNVSAFLHSLPLAPLIVIEGLRLLKVSDDQMRKAGINPKGGLMEDAAQECGAGGTGTP